MAEKKDIDIRVAAAWVLIIAGSIAILLYFKAFLRPLVVAVILWFLIREVRKGIARIRLFGRALPAVLISILSSILVIGVIYGIADIIIINIEKLAANIDRYNDNITKSLEEIEAWIGMDNLGERVAAQGDNVEQYVRTLAGSVTTFVGRFILITLYLIFLLLEEKNFEKKMDMLLSHEGEGGTTRTIIERLNILFSSYVSIKVLTSFLTGILSFGVLLFIGVELAGLWAFLIFLLNFIPSVGSLIATLFPALFSILQDGSPTSFLQVFVGVGIVQLLVGNVLEPRIMGNRLNLSPLVVIIGLTLWGFLWGILGMLLSVPIMATLMILCSQYPNTRPIAILLSRNGDISSMIPRKPDQPTSGYQKYLDLLGKKD